MNIFYFNGTCIIPSLCIPTPSMTPMKAPRTYINSSYTLRTKMIENQDPKDPMRTLSCDALWCETKKRKTFIKIKYKKPLKRLHT